MKPRTRKRIRNALLGALGLGAGCLAVVWGLGCCVFSAPGHEGEVSDHFDGERFFNPWQKQRESRFGRFWKWQWNREMGPWPEWVGAEPGENPPERVGEGELRVTFVGHATTLIQMDGLNILTDPIWSKRASPFSWVGPKRRRPPGIRFEDLPPIDAVLLSHNHYDSYDVATLERLAQRDKPPIYVGLGVGRSFAEEKIPGGVEMDWWQSAPLSKSVTLHAVPAQHFSARGTCDRNKTLWLGFVVEGPAGAVYFAGDTGFGPHFDQIAGRFPRIRLALLPIGAYKPRWFMKEAHTAPAEAAQAHRRLLAWRSLAIHFRTFPLGDDGMDEPAAALSRAREQLGIPAEEFWILSEGEGREVPAIEEAELAERAGRLAPSRPKRKRPGGAGEILKQALKAATRKQEDEARRRSALERSRRRREGAAPAPSPEPAPDSSSHPPSAEP